MKKLLFGILAVTTMITLVACGEKEEAPTNEPATSVVENANQPENETPVVENNEEEEENLPEEGSVEEEKEEEVGVGNTDEGMVILTIEDYLIANSENEIEEVTFNKVKVYSPEEIEENDAIKSHNLSEGDIAFEIDYELKIAEGTEDLMKYTAATGEIDGQYIRNKHNVGILRANETGYTVDAFGTGF